MTESDQLRRTSEREESVRKFKVKRRLKFDRGKILFIMQIQEHMSDSFDSFICEARYIVDTSRILTTLRVNDKFDLAIKDDWFFKTKLVDDDKFKVVNEKHYYDEFWETIIQDIDLRYRSTRFIGAAALFKGRKITGITFTSNTADLSSKNCFILEDMNTMHWTPEELNLREIADFEWYTHIVFLKSGKILAVKMDDLTSTQDGFGFTLPFRLYAKEFRMPRYAELLYTAMLIKDYSLSNFVLRYSVDISRGICQYNLLVEIFRGTTRVIENLNPIIEVIGAEEGEMLYDSVITELLYGIHHRILESVNGKKEEDIGPELRLFYGLAPSHQKVLYG
jgi:hypothetical protein